MISFRVWLMSFVLGGLISAPSAEALMQPQASNPRITLKNDGASPLFIYQIEDEDFDQLIAEIEPGTARSLELPPGELHQICTQATVFAEFTTGTVDPTVWSLLDGTQPFAEIHVGGLPDATISAAHLATLWNKGFDARGTWISPDGLKLFVVSGSDEGMMIDVRWPSVTQAWRLTRVAGQDRLFELVSVVEADGTVSTTLPSGKANLRFIGVAEAILTTGGAEDRYLRSTGDALDASWQRPVQLHVGNERFDTIELQELPARKGPRPRAAEEQSLQTTVITAGDSAVITAAAGTKLSVVVQGGDDLGVIEASSLPRQEIAVGYRWIAHSAWPNSRALQAAASNTASPTGAYSLTLKTSIEPTAGTDSKLEVRFCGADDTRLHRAYASKWVISAVARIYRPGAKADHVLILEGLQGRRKSTALEALAGEDWFTDAADRLTDKDGVLNCSGKLIMELGELVALGRAEATQIKSFFSRRTDRIRRPYGRSAEDIPRQTVFCGTTNATEYLRDETGNRRFWSVKVGKVDVEGIREQRDQLWAEAIARYRAGESWWIDDDRLLEDAEASQEERRHVDPWVEKIDTWLRESAKHQVTLNDIIEGCFGAKLTEFRDTDTQRAARAILGVGWVKKQKWIGEGRRRWIYEKPARVVE